VYSYIPWSIVTFYKWGLELEEGREYEISLGA